MSDKVYPVPYYKEGEATPQYAHSPKDEKRLQEDGWGEGYIYREYPKSVYAKDGSTATVQSKAEEDKLVKQGYSLKPIAPKPPKPHAEAAHAGRVDDLEQRVSDLEEKIDEILAAVTK